MKVGDRVTIARSTPRLIDAFCDQLWLQDGLARRRSTVIAAISTHGRRGSRPQPARRRPRAVEGWLARSTAKVLRPVGRAAPLHSARFYRLQMERAAIRDDPRCACARRGSRGGCRSSCPKRRSRRCWPRRISNAAWHPQPAQCWKRSMPRPSVSELTSLKIAQGDSPPAGARAGQGSRNAGALGTRPSHAAANLDTSPGLSGRRQERHLF